MICNRVFESGRGLKGHMQTHCTLEELVKRASYGAVMNSIRFRALLFKSGRSYTCEICQQGDMWCGQSLTLQVDHINGDNKNHELTNLRFLCPNCHTQTSTYGRKKRTEF